jgi:cytidylate kinase
MTARERRLTIAIDGTAGSGKSALGSALAQRLGYVFVDTGAFYRVLTLAALRTQISLEDGPALAALAQTLEIHFEPPTQDDGRQFTLLLGKEDVTWAVRSPEVDNGVSPVAAQPEARAALLPLQQRLAQQKGVVMVGRDIGTVVAPEAEVKVFLKADLATRAQRRRQDLTNQGTRLTTTDVAQNLTERDRIDSERATAPLVQHPDALELDTGKLTIEEELAAVLARVAAAKRIIDAE